MTRPETLAIGLAGAMILTSQFAAAGNPKYEACIGSCKNTFRACMGAQFTADPSIAMGRCQPLKAACCAKC